MENSLELIELSSINAGSLVWVFSCSNTGSRRDDAYWTSGENSLEVIELSSINKVSLVHVPCCSNTGSIRDDPYWTSRENSLEVTELSSKFSLNIFQCSFYFSGLMLSNAWSNLFDSWNGHLYESVF
jgi:hypothetical protein